MTNETLKVLAGLVLMELINCKDRESKYYESIIKANNELKEFKDDKLK